MIRFLKRLNDRLEDPRYRRGPMDEVLVDRRALLELIHKFEELDAYCRVTSPEARRKEINAQLHEAIHAVYENQNKNAETALLVIMDTLQPLMRKRERDRQIQAYYNGKF